ncbi:MAG: NF038122 family metalloprotease [Planctomycetes bacterium]|nr:NF038122 family metalloprotease [Planctomycetota bacterium]
MRIPSALAASFFRPIGFVVLPALIASAASAAAANSPSQASPVTPRMPVFVQPLPPQVSTLYANGAQVLVPMESVWRPVCGPGLTTLTSSDLRQIAASHEATMSTGQVIQVDFSHKDAGINFVFNVSGSIPSGALGAIATAEAYMESQFNDPITVTVNLSFATLASNVLGGTGSSYTNVTWANARNGLIAGKDASDTIQSSLPTTSTIPVRYSNSATVTNETRVFFTVANYRATIGAINGTAASMQYNNIFAWDFDPSNGITAGTYSFVDVVIHETGHAMGFTSGIDFRVNDIEAIDIFRFQRTDGTGDYNPDTLAEFQTRARLAAFNAPNDDQNCDLISVEYRMSDGSPYQASHFREQTANIGIMDPAFAAGQTYFPNYYKASDTNLFDAIGYDR